MHEKKTRKKVLKIGQEKKTDVSIRPKGRTKGVFKGPSSLGDPSRGFADLELLLQQPRAAVEEGVDQAGHGEDAADDGAHVRGEVAQRPVRNPTISTTQWNPTGLIDPTIDSTDIVGCMVTPCFFT